MSLSEPILRFLGEMVLYGGGSATIAYLLFQFLGRSWIESKFAQRLDQHKHQQALELQRLRVEIDSMLNGALKLQEREFQVLPEAWQKLDEAYGRANWLTSPTQQFVPVGTMANDELEEYLSSSELLESQKAKVRASDSRDRDKTYQDITYWHRLVKVKKAIADLQDYVARNGIFLPSPLKEKFSEVVPVLWSAVSASEIGHAAEDYMMQGGAWKELQARGEPLYKAIESEIQRRLRSHADR